LLAAGCLAVLAAISLRAAVETFGSGTALIKTPERIREFRSLTLLKYVVRISTKARDLISAQGGWGSICQTAYRLSIRR
jgi:hypothetical protein